MRKTLLLSTLLLPLCIWAQGDAHQLYNEAKMAYDAKDLALAESKLNDALAADSMMAKAYKLRGDVKQRNEDIEGALEDYDISRDIDPENVRLYVSRAAARITKGNLRSAMKDLDRAAELAPEDPDIWYNRACAYYLGGDNKGAMRQLERSIELKGDHADGLYLRGVIKGEMYQEEGGLEDIEAALALKPEIPGGVMSAGVLLYEMKKYEEAIEKFGQVIKEHGDGRAEAFYYRGDSYYELGDKEKACQDWRLAGRYGDTDASYIVKNYCETDAKRKPKLRRKRERTTTIQF